MAESRMNTGQGGEIKESDKQPVELVTVTTSQEGACSLLAYFYNNAHSVSHETEGKTMWDQDTKVCSAVSFTQTG